MESMEGNAGGAAVVAGIGSFVALGDSFTEGIGDPRREGGYLGWADRFAEMLATQQPGLRYANLAVRGKLLNEIVEEQVPRAVAMALDLVSLAAGGNDILRPGADPDALAELFDSTVVSLRAAGCRVLVFTGSDPRIFPVIRLLRGKIATYNMHLRAIADSRGCDLVDLWSMRVLGDPRAWSADRLHLNPEGHRRVALRACEVLGMPVDDDWRLPLPSESAGVVAAAVAGAGAVAVRGVVGVSARLAAAVPARLAAAVPARLAAGVPARLAARRQDARWMREYAMPWVGRRLRGASSGDDVLPKRPDLLPV
jgi:lysophospholipase L1-like esterase